MSAFANHTGHPASDFLCAIVPLQLRDDGAQAECDRIGLAVMHGPDLDVVKRQKVKDCMAVRLPPGDAVESLDDQDIKFPRARGGHEIEQAIAAVNACSGLRGILENGNDGKPLARGVLAAKRNLISAGSGALQVR